MKKLIGKKGATSPMLLVIGTILAIGIIATLYFVIKTNVSQDVNNNNPNVENSVTCSDSTGILTVNAYSKLAPSTSFGSASTTCGIGDGPIVTSVTSGTTTFAVGSKLKCLVDNTTQSLSGVFNLTMPCGGVKLDAPLYKAVPASGNTLIRIKNTDGDYMTDSVGSTNGSIINQSSPALGDVMRLDVEFAGNSLESTGDLIWVVEFAKDTNANISNIELTGATVIPVPSVYSAVNTSSKLVAFEIPAVIGADKKTHTLVITLGATKDLFGPVQTVAYAKQSYIDTDGTIKYGVVDSQGTSKYQYAEGYDFFISA